MRLPLNWPNGEVFGTICELYGTIHEIGNWVFVEAVKQRAGFKQLLICQTDARR